MGLSVTVMSMDFDSDLVPTDNKFEKNEIYLGRLPGNDLVLNHPAVSSQHASLKVTFNGDGGKPHFFITDLHSTNGTFIGNLKLEAGVETPVGPSDRIRVGSFLIRAGYIVPAAKVPEKVPQGKLIGTPTRQTAPAEAAPVQSKFGKLDEETVEELGAVESEEPQAGDPTPFEEEVSQLAEEVPAAEDVNSIPPDRTVKINAKVSIDEEGRVSVTPQPQPEKAKVAPAPVKKVEPVKAAPAAPEPVKTPEPIQEKVKVEVKEEVKKEANKVEVKEMKPVEIPVEEPVSTDAAEAAVIEVAVEDQEIENLNFEALKLCVLSGRVTNKGAPLSGVCVKAGSLGECETDTEGAFAFKDLLEGTFYSLEVKKDGFRVNPNESSGSITDDVNVVFDAVRLLKVKGQVTHRGQPLSGVEVDGGPLGKVSTAEDGSYIFHDVPEGTKFQLKVARPGYKFKSGN